MTIKDIYDICATYSVTTGHIDMQSVHLKYIYNSFYNVDILLVNVMLLGGDLRRIRDAGAGPLPMIEEPLGPENGRKCDEISRFRLVF